MFFQCLAGLGGLHAAQGYFSDADSAVDLTGTAEIVEDRDSGHEADQREDHTRQAAP